jgi:hypothetical protein
LSPEEGFVEIRHNTSSVVDIPGIEKHLYTYSGISTWYSGYARMNLSQGLKIGQSVSKGALIGTISNVNAAKDPSIQKQLMFIMYDKDGVSFSPYLLSKEYQNIQYSSDIFTIGMPYRSN